MAIRGECPTPKKLKYRTLNFAEHMLAVIKHNTDRTELEIYECGEHWHIRDTAKRKRKEHERYRERQKLRRKYRQLTIYDWMNEIHGPQGV